MRDFVAALLLGVCSVAVSAEEISTVPELNRRLAVTCFAGTPVPNASHALYNATIRELAGETTEAEIRRRLGVSCVGGVPVPNVSHELRNATIREMATRLSAVPDSMWQSLGFASSTVIPPTTAANAKPADWNTMNAAQQARWSEWLCRDDPSHITNRCQSVPASIRSTTASAPDTRPANWNLWSASEQTYWLQRGSLPPRQLTPDVWRTPAASVPPTGSQDVTRCGRACGERWTAEDLADSEREIARLEREIANLDTQIRISRRAAPTPRAIPTAPSTYSAYRAPTPHASATQIPIGGTTFYSDSNGVTGTANKIGGTTFYNYSDGTSGTASRVGSSTYYNLSNRQGDTTNGTSTTIGQFQYHNLSNGVSGSSTQVGGFTYTNFSTGKQCTSSQIGTFVYTNCN